MTSTRIFLNNIAFIVLQINFQYMQDRLETSSNVFFFDEDQIIIILICRIDLQMCHLRVFSTTLTKINN